MKATNNYEAMIEVRVFVNGKPGAVKQVMPGIPEELFGPAFMKDAAGMDICLTIPGEVYFSSSTHNPALFVLLVRPERITSCEWKGEDGTVYRIVAKDYRLDTRVRQSR